MRVGVPDVDELLAMIEDGEEVATLAQMHTEQSGDLTKMIAERSHERLGRRWQRALDKTVLAMQGEDDDMQEPESFAGWIQTLSLALDPVYLADIQLRFGLSGVTDQARLVVLEQHPEVRRPWCESMIPFIANRDFKLVWRELVESIWGFQPITSDYPATEFLSWYDSQAKTSLIVLSLHPLLRLRNPPWSEEGSDQSARKDHWRQVDAMAIEHSFRAVQSQELAILIHNRSLQAVDMIRPSPARYVMLKPKKRKPSVVRELDPPGRFAGLLKQSKTSLVKP